MECLAGCARCPLKRECCEKVFSSWKQRNFDRPSCGNSSDLSAMALALFGNWSGCWMHSINGTKIGFTTPRALWRPARNCAWQSSNGERSTQVHSGCGCRHGRSEEHTSEL